MSSRYSQYSTTSTYGSGASGSSSNNSASRPNSSKTSYSGSGSSSYRRPVDVYNASTRYPQDTTVRRKDQNSAVYAGSTWSSNGKG